MLEPTVLHALKRSMLLAFLLLAIAVPAQAVTKSSCTASGATLQVLGSGSPVADDGRASSGYLLSVNGKSKFLIDTCGGVFLRFVDFSKNADVLVMHMPVPEGVSGAARQLHAPPSVIGEIAQRANADSLVLSHFMAGSLGNLVRNVSITRSCYDGEVLVADDLDCVAVAH